MRSMNPFRTTAKKKSVRRRGGNKWLRKAAPVAAVTVPVLLLAGGAVWLWRAGYVAEASAAVRDGVADAAGSFGLSVGNVYLEGRENAGKDEVMTALQVRRGAPLFGFDLFAAKARLEALPWVQSAAVERRTPDTIYVRIVERQPFALWQHDGRVMLVDHEGVVLTDKGLDRFGNLLLLVGPEAPAHAQELFDLIAVEPDLARRVTAAVRVGGRRWNVQLDDSIEVKLPEDDAAGAWTRLAQVERSQGILKRDLAAVDLRLPDRLVVTLPTEVIARPKPGRKPGTAGKDHET
ncbi:MAG: cell division protein FtsQ/DivIB [Alphaproteobacteria bacterium]